MKKDLLRKKVSVGEAIISVLEEAGIDMVFGMQGGNTRYIFDALYYHRSTIRTVLVRHESLAGVMAEVYGRLTGKPGVCIGQGPWMLSNALLGVMEAHLGSSPILLLSDLSDGAPFSHHAPYQAGTGDYGTWNARQSFAGVTKYTFVPQQPVQAVQCTQLAIKHALSGNRGPVAVLYHSSAFSEQVGPNSVPKLYKTQQYLPDRPTGADGKAIEDAVGMILAAKNPVIVAGNGVRIANAYDQLRYVAEMLGAPVGTTTSGKGVFPENHELSIGVIGAFGHPLANAIIGSADVILIVGSKLSPSDTIRESQNLFDPNRQYLIQIDIEPKNAGWTFPCDHKIVGDAKIVLSQLLEAIRLLGNFSKDVLAFRKKYLKKCRINYGFFNDSKCASNEIPILPQRTIAELQNSLADDAIVTCDAGENRLFMLHYFQTKNSQMILMPGSIGGMGYAIPAALAAKLIYPKRQVVAVCGDAGFAMSMNGIITAYEENIPIVTVVFNNSALGWVRHGQGNRTIASKLADMDYAKIARGIGCVGVRIDDPKKLGGSLTDALKRKKPAVIDVVTALKPTFKDIMSPLALS